MKLGVDEQFCTGYGNCKKAAPDVYVLDELGFNRTLTQTVPKNLEQQAREGAAVCPEQAIFLEEE